MRVFNLTLLLRGLINEFMYLFFRVTGFRIKSPLSPQSPVLTVIPFRYIFLSRFGERYVIDSAFFRRYYDGFKIRRGMTVIDVGAHIGTFAIRCARKGAVVYAIEPEPSAYEILTMNVRMNKLTTKITPLRLAISSQRGKAKLYLHPFTGSSLYRESKCFVEVRLARLDDLFDIFGISQVDLLKINAEGAELDILKSLGEKIAIVRRVIVAAHHYPEQAEQCRNYLETLGFKALIWHGKDNVLVYASRT